MSGIKSISSGRTDIFWLDPTLIKEIPGWNVREETVELEEHIRALADSISVLGVQEPITVFMDGDDPILTNGHCRLMAVRLAMSEGVEIKSIPVRVENRYSNEADRICSLITRNSGKPLSSVEMSKVVMRLVNLGWNKKDIAAKLGFSVSKVDNLFILGSAPQNVVTMINEGTVTPSTVIEVIRKDGPDAGSQALVDASSEVKGKVKIEDVAGHKKESKFDQGFYAGLFHALAVVAEIGHGNRDVSEACTFLFGGSIDPSKILKEDLNFLADTFPEKVLE